MKHVKCKLCDQEHPLGGCPKFKMKPRGAIQKMMERPLAPKKQTPRGRRAS